MDGKEIVSRINTLIAQRGISKEQFFKDCHLSSASYSQWNTGKCLPKAKKVDEIAKYFDVTANYITFGVEEKKPKPEDQMSYTEHVLVNCWRRASEDDRDIITAVLKKYGFSYSSEKIEETMAVS